MPQSKTPFDENLWTTGGNGGGGGGTPPSRRDKILSYIPKIPSIQKLRLIKPSQEELSEFDKANIKQKGEEINQEWSALSDDEIATTLEEDLDFRDFANWMQNNANYDPFMISKNFNSSPIGERARQMYESKIKNDAYIPGHKKYYDELAKELLSRNSLSMTEDEWINFIKFLGGKK